jgi:hypothetical protein
MSRKPAHSGRADSGSASTRRNARRTPGGRPVAASRTVMPSNRSPGVCPVADQKSTKYPMVQASATVAPIVATTAFSTSWTSTTERTSVTTTPTTHTTALITAASIVNARVRVARPA